MCSAAVLRVWWSDMRSNVSSICRRGCADEAGKLVFGLDLLRHQIEQRNAERTNVLPCGLIFVHDADAFTGEDVICGQGGWNLDGHGLCNLLSIGRAGHRLSGPEASRLKGDARGCVQSFGGDEVVESLVCIGDGM